MDFDRMPAASWLFSCHWMGVLALFRVNTVKACDEIRRIQSQISDSTFLPFHSARHGRSIELWHQLLKIVTRVAIFSSPSSGLFPRHRMARTLLRENSHVAVGRGGLEIPIRIQRINAIAPAVALRMSSETAVVAGRMSVEATIGIHHLSHR